MITKYVPVSLTPTRALAERPSDAASCPYCANQSLHCTERYSTLLAGGTGIDNNPNHVHYSYNCLYCGQSFCRETKSGKVWYTKDGHVLRGHVNCFESYTYDCQCSGKLYRTNTKMDGITQVTSEYYKSGVPQFRTFWTCNKCHTRHEVTENYL